MLPSLHIVADAHIWGVESAFCTLPGFNIHLRVLEHGDIGREALKHADILLTRSSTKVNSSLLQGTAVRFAATATIGDDHVDKLWLQHHGIDFANAAGSSTGSVIEYMITTLLELQARKLINIPDTSMGIIGVGRIGGRLEHICKAMGMRVFLNDPPRARAEGEVGFSSLDEILEQADVLSLHTPLINTGEDCTVHLLDKARLSAFMGQGIINAGRGACIDNTALADWLDGDATRFAVLDCWEHEPVPSHRLLAHPQLAIGTPHIAGHSLDGKAANTQYAYNALCQWLDIPPEWDMSKHLPPAGETVKITCTGNTWRDLHIAISKLYPINTDNKSMHAWSDIPDTRLAEAFTRYRRHYPVRRAWEHIPVQFSHANQETLKLAQVLGIKIV